MSILRLPLEMIEVCHNVCHVWPFPLKAGVFTCCPAPTTAGQMELRKTRVTALFVLAGCVVCHLRLSVCCLICVILVCRVPGTGRVSHPSAWFWGNVQICPCFMWRWFSKLTVVYSIKTDCPRQGFFSLCAFSSAVRCFFVSIVYISNIPNMQICFLKSPGIEELL